MDPFKCYTNREAIGNKTGSTRIQPQGYSRITNNLQRVGNLIYNYRIELRRGPSQTAQISDPRQEGKALLKFVILHCSEEAKLGDRKESSSRILIRYYEEGVIKPFKNSITCRNERKETKKHPVPPILLVYYLLSDASGLATVPTVPKTWTPSIPTFCSSFYFNSLHLNN